MARIKSIKNKKPNINNYFFKFNNTIALSIAFVIIIVVSFVELSIYAYLHNSTVKLQKEITSNFISNLKVINFDVINKRFDLIQHHINSSLSSEYQVKYILVLDYNLNKVYSNPKHSNYIFTVPNSPKTFKLKNATGLNADNLKILHIFKSNYHIYLGIDKGDIEEENIIDQNIAKLFFIAILLLSIGISIMLARTISQPLSDMGKTINKISEGDLSGRLDYTNYYEINRLVQSYNTMANTLQRLYSTLENQVQDRTRELKNAYAELQSTQAMMVHSEKMKSLGELVAGIMHEINNPINFIYGNMTHLNNYSNDLINIIETYTKFDNNLNDENRKEINDLKTEIDYDFLKSDLPDLIRSCREGADRAKNIIQDLKSFSRMEEIAITDVDIPHEIDMVLNILHNKIKNKAEIHKEYMENIPQIEAFGGQLNQVFMNILDNAAGAIEKTGDIWIRIKYDNKNLSIEIEDNGQGMNAETARKVFDPFFTTKPVGQGTGLGLSITHKIIENHQGKIKVESEEGKGSKFIITLPLHIDVEKMNSAILKSGEE